MLVSVVITLSWQISTAISAAIGSNGALCASDAQCSGKTECSLSYNITTLGTSHKTCVPKSCTSDSQCPNTLQCVSNECRPYSCEEHPDCQELSEKLGVTALCRVNKCFSYLPSTVNSIPVTQDETKEMGSQMEFQERTWGVLDFAYVLPSEERGTIYGLNDNNATVNVLNDLYSYIDKVFFTDVYKKNGDKDFIYAFAKPTDDARVVIRPIFQEEYEEQKKLWEEYQSVTTSATPKTPKGSTDPF